MVFDAKTTTTTTTKIHLLPSLRVSDDAPSDAHVLEHVGRGLSGVGAVAGGPAVLGGHLSDPILCITNSTRVTGIK